MILAALIAICLVLYSSHPVLMIFSLLSLYLSYVLFWRRYEPKVIFFGVFMSWLSITIKIFYSDITGIRYESLSSSVNIIQTTYVSLLGFCIFCLGLWFAIKDLRLSNEKMNELFYRPVNFRRMLIVYLVASVINTVLKSFVFYFPGLSQFLSGFLQMKMGFLFLIIFYALKKKEHLLLVLGIIIAEVVLSLFSFFSSFKDIIITAIVIVAIFPNRLNARQSAVAVVLGCGFLYSVFVWQSVKGDYRKFLNAGERTQTVVVSQEDALKKLQELSEKSGESNKKDVLYQTIDRISYIEFFSQATENVPRKIAYENGKLWTDNVMHIFQPRILFPNKEAIDDSKMVNKYATRKVATAKMGASFSLGYMAESYIDFGPYFMFIPIFLVGWLLGFIYKTIILQSVNYLWGFTMVSSLWININCNGTPGTKILGWILMYYIAFLFFRYLLMKPLDNYIRGGVFKH
ncbi:MAG: hypothetical protein JNM14_12415 [Ferruginibacter sp.]|nr:hypothetical protein [Ferruginibacter sp.]